MNDDTKKKVFFVLGMICVLAAIATIIYTIYEVRELSAQVGTIKGLLPD